MRPIWCVWMALVAGCAQPLATNEDPAALRAGDDWPMYGRDMHHTFANTTSRITASNVGALVPAWSIATDDAVTASPSIAGGILYIGDWTGAFRAIDTATGTVRWTFTVDCDNAFAPVPARCLAPGQDPPERYDSDGGLITSSALVQDGTVYVAGGKTLYALAADTGQLRWKRVLCGNPEMPVCEADAADPTRIFSSPVIADGKLLVGTSVDGAAGYRGRIVALHINDGRPAWSFEVDAGQNRGCGNVWSSATIDERGGLAIFGTADCNATSQGPYAETVLALALADGAVRWAFHPAPDTGCDTDFGATANLLDLGVQRSVGIGSKNGTYYVLDAQTGAQSWATNVVFGGDAGGFIGSTAYDGHHIFGGTALGDFSGCASGDPRDQPIQDPSFHAFGLDGSVAWENPNSYSFGSTTAANGVVFNTFVGLSADDPPALRAYDSQSGALLLELPQAGSVESSATITSDSIYFGTGNSYDGTGGSIQAYRLP